MNNKKCIIISLLIAVLLFSIICICFFFNKSNDNIDSNSNKIQVNHIDLLQQLGDYTDLSDIISIDIAHIFNNIIYGTMETDKIDSMLFSTVAVFSYDILSGELTIIPQLTDKRVIDFCIQGDQIFYCYLFSNDNTFDWELVNVNLNTNESKEILNGSIDYFYEYPRFFAQDNNEMFFISKSNKVTEIYKIENLEFEKLITFNDDSVSSYNMDAIRYKDNKIYCPSTADNDIDNITIIDTKNRTNSVIYKSSDSSHKIYTFNVTEDKLIIQEVIEQDKSDLVTFNIDYNIIESEIETKLLTFPELISNDNILIHQPNNTWKTYCISQSEFYDLDFPTLRERPFPKYYLIHNNCILVQDFSNDFYVIYIYM